MGRRGGYISSTSNAPTPGEATSTAPSEQAPSASTPRFLELVRAHGGDQDDDNDAEDIQRMLLELDDEQLLERFVELLKHEVCEILRLPAARLDTQRPLQELGLDSLMSVELVVALEERFQFVGVGRHVNEPAPL